MSDTVEVKDGQTVHIEDFSKAPSTMESDEKRSLYGQHTGVFQEEIAKDSTLGKQDEELENSPIDMVRAAVPVTDDPSMPCLTFRFWTLGLSFTVLGAVISQYNFYRTNAIAYSIFFVNLVSFALGKAMAKTLPHWNVGYGRYCFSLNPGPFNIKEHMLIGIMASAGGTSAYASDIISIQKLFFHQDMGILGGLLLLITSQCIGYGMAGFLRNYLVKPAAMYWPANLPSVVFYNTLHKTGVYNQTKVTKGDAVVDTDHGLDSEKTSIKDNISASMKRSDIPLVVPAGGNDHTDGIRYSADTMADTALPTAQIDAEVNTESSTRKWTRMKVFWLVFGCIFIWELLPGHIMPILGSLAWLCWINPTSKNFWAYFSGRYGCGILNLSLDWNSIGGGTLYVPWWAQANQYFGAILFYWIILPILWKNNTLDGQLFKPVTSHLYTVNGSHYNTTAVLDPSTHMLNETAYNEYGPLRMAPQYAINFGLSFISLMAAFVHVALYYGKDIWSKWRLSRVEDEDIHTKMMKVYPEVPLWWYVVLLVVTFALSIVTVTVWPIYLPWYGLILTVVIAVVTVLPLGVICAISNTLPGLNVVTELICGYIWPGRPIANVAFKTYGYMAMFQCILLVSDLKLGHYMKIPPRAMFTTQLAGTIVGAVVNLAVLNIVIDSKRSYIDGTEIDPSGTIDGRQPQIFYASSVIFGAIGPARVFSSDGPYSFVFWGFLIGLLLPIPFYFLHRRYPKQFWHLINIPIIAGGMAQAPQIPTNTILSSAIMGFIFTFYLYRYRRAFWQKYVYITAAALDSGTQICGIFIFVFLGGFYAASMPTWWGNGENLEQCGAMAEIAKY
ncbi:hypothetical protein BZG36_04256 [Bifiguratus adelaidae]|uniref:OPT family small oligopeptide transporter n=1 Tax=Bifiguratus adelaidae TaxID=1938954 RepID=A0A261XVY0_9FUNG|nr:hypothetical protein BZG36_04256 [Bifiguratus adelaidae]